MSKLQNQPKSERLYEFLGNARDSISKASQWLMSCDQSGLDQEQDQALWLALDHLSRSLELVSETRGFLESR